MQFTYRDTYCMFFHGCYTNEGSISYQNFTITGIFLTMFNFHRQSPIQLMLYNPGLGRRYCRIRISSFIWCGRAEWIYQIFFSFPINRVLYSSPEIFQCLSHPPLPPHSPPPTPIPTLSPPQLPFYNTPGLNLPYPAHMLDTERAISYMERTIIISTF